MKPPRVDRFDSKQKIKPEPVDFSGVPSIEHKTSPSPEVPQVIEPKPLQSTLPTSGKTPLDSSTNQSINPPINRLINQSNNSLMQKPVGFYISPHLDERLDTAVRYYKEKHGFRKVDRSVVLNALLESGENWTDQALDLLVSRVITILTRKLTG
jgi:hypothetical protein